MKLFSRAHVIYAMLAATCVPSIKAQDQALRTQEPQAPITFNYKAINFPGATATLAYGINNSNEVVGYYTGAGCSQTSCGFSLLKGTFTTIECALENATDVFDISSTGEIIGTYSFFGGVHGFIWEGNGSCFDIVDPLGPSETEAWGVNKSGQIVGWYVNSLGLYQGFEYDNGTYTTISCAGWANTRTYGINDAGIIVGDVASSTTGPFSGFTYKSGTCTIFNYPNAADTYERGINNKNQITGFYTNSAGTFGFGAAGSTSVTLSYPGSTGTLAYHANDHATVAGFYSDTSGTHGFTAAP
jgi:hypothetical protein